MATLFVHPNWGDDGNTGLTREQALRTVDAAQQKLVSGGSRISPGPNPSDSHRITLLQGDYIGAVDIANFGNVPSNPVNPEQSPWIQIIGEGLVSLDCTGIQPVISGHMLFDNIIFRNMPSYLLDHLEEYAVVVKNCIFDAAVNGRTFPPGGMGGLCAGFRLLTCPNDPTVYPDRPFDCRGHRIERNLFLATGAGPGIIFEASSSTRAVHMITHNLFWNHDVGAQLSVTPGSDDMIQFRSNIVARNISKGVVIPTGYARVSAQNNAFWQNGASPDDDFDPLAMLSDPSFRYIPCFRTDPVGPVEWGKPGFQSEDRRVFYIKPLQDYGSGDVDNVIIGAGHDGLTIGPYGFGPWAHYNMGPLPADAANWGDEDFVIDKAMLPDGKGWYHPEPWIVRNYITQQAYTIQGGDEGWLTSPVYDFGELRLVRRILFSAMTNEMLGSGGIHTIDSPNPTPPSLEEELRRTFEFRWFRDDGAQEFLPSPPNPPNTPDPNWPNRGFAWNANDPLGGPVFDFEVDPLDPHGADWQPITQGELLDMVNRGVYARYFQVRFRLTITAT